MFKMNKNKLEKKPSINDHLLSWCSSKQEMSKKEANHKMNRCKLETTPLKIEQGVEASPAIITIFRQDTRTERTVVPSPHCEMLPLVYR